MEFLYIILGIFLDRPWQHVFDSFQSWQSNRHWTAVNNAYRDIGHLTGRLEIVQLGWSAGAFDETHVLIQLDGKYEIPDDVFTDILHPAHEEWMRQGFKDNLQCGVRDLQILRTTDNPLQSGPVHEIRILAHTYSYFESKATHFEWLSGCSHDLLAKYAANARHDAYAQKMPTPLSVGLSLFCEDGKTLILTSRTTSTGAGGHVAGGQYFNAVSENCAPIDAFGEVEGKMGLSIFRTATRGLLEEMGLDLRQVVGSKPVLHTLCWDKEILDYKFSGYVICPLAAEEVRDYWHHAPDKSENREFISQDVNNREATIRLIQHMQKYRENWSDEARTCTLMSLLHMKHLTVSDLIAAIG